MRKIDLIVIHCSATKEGKDYTVGDITRWHKQRGFRTIGYHWVVYRDGTVHQGRPESEVGAHASGYNSRSIGVCYIGGLDARTGKGKDTRTPEQKVALERLVRELLARYPGSRVVGHRDLSPDRNHDGKITPNEWTKSCPCFEAKFIIKDPLPSSPC